MYKNLVHTSQKTCRLAIMKNRALIVLTQIIDYCSTRPKCGVWTEGRLIAVTIDGSGESKFVPVQSTKAYRLR
jgi:hypothetical protein